MSQWLFYLILRPFPLSNSIFRVIFLENTIPGLGSIWTRGASYLASQHCENNLTRSDPRNEISGTLSHDLRRFEKVSQNSDSQIAQRCSQSFENHPYFIYSLISNGASLNFFYSYIQEYAKYDRKFVKGNGPKIKLKISQPLK